MQFCIHFRCKSIDGNGQFIPLFAILYAEISGLCEPFNSFLISHLSSPSPPMIPDVNGLHGLSKSSLLRSQTVHFYIEKKNNLVTVFTLRKRQQMCSSQKRIHKAKQSKANRNEGRIDFVHVSYISIYSIDVFNFVPFVNSIFYAWQM